MKNITQIIKSANRHAKVSENTIRRRHVEMKIWNRKLRNISLSTLKPKTPHPGFHENGLGSDLHEVERGSGEGGEEGNGGGDTGLEFGEGGFGVREGCVGLGEDPHDGPFCGVGEGLDLEGYSEGVSFVS